MNAARQPWGREGGGGSFGGGGGHRGGGARGPLPRPDAGAPLSRGGTGDGRDGALCRAPSGALAGAGGVLGAGAEVRGARPLDWLGVRRPVRPSAPGDQQLALPYPPRRPAQPRLASALVVHAPPGERLAGALRSRSATGRDFRGPGSLPGHRLPRRQLGRGRAHPRLRARRARLPRTRAAQAGVPSSPVPAHAGPPARHRFSTPVCYMECPG